MKIDDLSHLSGEEKLELLRLLELRDRRLRENWLEQYKPYAKQREFHERGAQFRERLFMAGNQLGKCATVSSYIPHPDGTRSTFGEMYRRGEPFAVWGWDGRGLVETAAVEPIIKPAEPCVRLWFANGEWFECALRHRVLLGDGSYGFVGDFLAPSSESDQPARGEGGPRSYGTLPGFQAGCLAGLRSCDALLHRAQGSVRAFARRLAGAQPRSSALYGSGACSTTRTSSGQHECGRLSSQGARARIGARFAAWLDRAACTFARRSSQTLQGAQRLVLGSVVGPRSGAEVPPAGFLQGAFTSFGMEGNRIVGYELIPSQTVYDFTVPETSNYVAAGVVHHNTYSGAAEVAYHATGLYPKGWAGKVFRRPISALVGSESAELTRKGVQRLLLGPPQRREEWGTGAIPKSHIVSTTMKSGVPDAVSSVVVKNEYGGESVIQFNSYDQGRMQHVDSRVLTPTGWRRIGDLRPGDRVIAGDGTPTRVEGVFPHGVKDLYELTFDSGVKTLAGAEHLWVIGERTTGPWRTVTTQDLIDRYGDEGGRVSGNRQVSTPNVGVVEFPPAPVPLDPYLVGALLGDGCVRAGRVRFTSCDDDIIAEVAAAGFCAGAEIAQWGEIQYGFRCSDEIQTALEDLGMADLQAHDKSVPRVYLWNEPAVRFAVLQGLMDTDGSVSAKGSMSFTSTSLQLAQDVAFLVRSFGGKATVRDKGSRDHKRTLYSVSIRMPGPPPFRLRRKAERCVRPACETHRHILRSIRKVQPGEAVCIAVEHPSHLYVTDDFIVTHNTKWQADTVDFVWMDEEPPEDIYFEALTRTNATGGLVMVTFTPLLGMSSVVKRFLTEKPESTNVTQMTIDDAEHYTPEERAKIIASYPEHEREARARGIPIMGSGLVFPVAESTIKVDPFPIPPHWGRVNAIDFGIDHPTAYVCLAHDRDTDTVYIYDCFRVTGKQATMVGLSPIALQTQLIRSRGYENVPTAWPHDGLQRDRVSGVQLKEQYRAQGLNMLPERITFEDGTNGVEAGLSLMLDRFQSRRLRVFSHLEEWFSEFRLYHRKDGLIVKIDDDLMSATRYGVMGLRFAKSLPELPLVGARRNQRVVVPTFEIFNADAGY